MIYTDKYNILDSKSIILDDINTRIYIPIEYEGKTEGEVMLAFVTEPGKIPEVRRDKIENRFALICVNFNEAYGRFTMKPFPIAELNGKQVAIHLGSYLAAGGNIRLLDYTIFMER